MVMRHPALIIAIAFGAAGCAPLQRPAGDHEATLIFQNESLSQATVFVMVAGMGTTRLGVVQAGDTDTLMVPANITRRSTSVNIVARLFASRLVPQTGPVAITAGDTFVVTLNTAQRLLSIMRMPEDESADSSGSP